LEPAGRQLPAALAAWGSPVCWGCLLLLLLLLLLCLCL
jgi:hypothetical protein